MSATSKTILLVDDDENIRPLTECFLQSFGYAVCAARDAQDALAAFDPGTHALVVTDNSMPGMNGMELARRIKERSPATPVLMYTGLPPEDCSAVDGVLPRPATIEELKGSVARLAGAP